ncbi:hypothetical protein C8F04DRAFT_1327930 [Mycena alexandri]|uniref:Uncharacterized protein n=1 Tax=Mycena alexandri TaxID=1745969 RepID=A0AAD6T285_9AGAR|nr:hypothetical protein C8F04DRAFT_1327930 [Mycena alexandri]
MRVDSRTKGIKIWKHDQENEVEINVGRYRRQYLQEEDVGHGSALGRERAQAQMNTKGATMTEIRTKLEETVPGYKGEVDGLRVSGNELLALVEGLPKQSVYTWLDEGRNAPVSASVAILLNCSTPQIPRIGLGTTAMRLARVVEKRIRTENKHLRDARNPGKFTEIADVSGTSSFMVVTKRHLQDTSSNSPSREGKHFKMSDFCRIRTHDHRVCLKFNLEPAALRTSPLSFSHSVPEDLCADVSPGFDLVNSESKWL